MTTDMPIRESRAPGNNTATDSDPITTTPAILANPANSSDVRRAPKVRATFAKAGSIHKTVAIARRSPTVMLTLQT